jgi:hypothetical protein
MGNGLTYGQTISVGVKGGIPLTDATRNLFGGDESRPYTVGPSIEMGLPAGFAIEAAALYRRTGATFNYNLGLFGVPGPAPAPINWIRGNSWEFPVLGKYYFRPRAEKWQPFIGTGWAFRTVGVVNEGLVTLEDPTGGLHSSSFRSEGRLPLDAGAVFAGGVRYRMGRFAISPEVRYTRWGSGNTISSKNDAGLFLGVTF